MPGQNGSHFDNLSAIIVTAIPNGIYSYANGDKYEGKRTKRADHQNNN